ncbi:MAG: DUF3597 domain-containing protein [Verrucomicrobiales bacterium]
MGLFNKLMAKIFGGAASSAPAAPVSTAPNPGAQPPPKSPSATSPASPAAPPSTTPPSTVDVAAVLDGLAAKNPEKLDWKRSIVDLMKLVGMDSSLAARKELAKELNYKGDQSDSAKMNVWLHQQVLKKLSENGGRVLAELLD